MDDIGRLINDARSHIAQSPFRDREDELASLLLPSVRLRPESRDGGEITLGSSRMGGLPDLPIHWPWPRWESYDPPNRFLKKESTARKLARQVRAKINRSVLTTRERQTTALSFICQLKLQELPWRSPEIPETGILFFFFDFLNQPWGFNPQDKGSFRVLYFDGPESELTQRSPPEDLQADCAFAPCALQATTEVVLPSSIQDLDIDDEDYEALFHRLIGSTEDVHHRFLGHPQEVQDDMRLICQVVAKGLNGGDSKIYSSPRIGEFREGAKDWQLLLQIDSDEKNPGWMWGDCGRIYFWIRREDLMNKSFENAWMILQCH